MSKFRETSRNEQFLLPLSINDFIPANHMARMIDELAERLDTKPIEDKYSRLGRKGYAPRMLIRLLFYGYSTGERSSRKIAGKCETDLAYMYLSGMDKPDFRTISDFRKNNIAELKSYFRDVVLFCHEAGLGRGAALFIDGTKIRANASAKKSVKKEKLDELINELDRSISDVFQEADDIDDIEDREFGDARGDELPPELRDPVERRKRLDEIKKKLDAEKAKKINLTDPDAKLMKERHGVIRPCYNCQVAVSEDGLILAQDAVCETNDTGQLESMTEAALKLFPEKNKVVADAGYGTYDNLEYLKKNGLDGYVYDFAGEIKGLLTGSTDKRYHYLNFKYDGERDCYICPEGKELPFFHEKMFRGRPNRTYHCKDCGCCDVREDCTRIQSRKISVDCRVALIMEMLEKFRSVEGWALYKKRMWTVEPQFGNMKQNLGYRQFLMRGKEKAKGEFSLMCIGHNLGKMFRKLKREMERTGKGLKGLLEEASTGCMKSLFKPPASSMA